MAPHTDDATPNGDGAAASRMVTSASAPNLMERGRKGVSIMIDTRDGALDDTDTVVLNSAPGSPSDKQQKAGGRAAWACNSPAGSRPGSRQSGGPMGSRFSSCSVASSSRGHSTSGRFSREEALCFKRVPTPSSSADSKRATYWDQGGSGEFRRKLADDNWNTLSVMKGKFYNHPRLSESVSHLSSEKSRSQKLNQKRQNQLRNQPAADLPDEALTAALLDEIYPRSPTAWQMRERDFVSFDSSADASPTPSGDSTRKTISRQRSNLGESSKRLSSAARSPDASTKLEVTASFEPTATIHTYPAAPMMSPSAATTANLANSGMMSTGGVTTAPASKEAMAAAGRRETLLEFRKQIFEKFATIKAAFDFFDREFPLHREMTKKEWRRVLVKLGFERVTIEERDAIFEQLDCNLNGHVSMNEFHVAIEAAAPVKTMEDLRRRWLASGYTSMAQAISGMDTGADGPTNAYMNKRLTLREFGDLLSRVCVIDYVEHTALFNAIADHNDTARTVKVSIGELAAALATVSPAAYLEEIRFRLNKRYGGSVEKAFWDIDQDHSGIISREEWRGKAVHRMGISDQEAVKMFDIIDFDHNHNISMSEFLCALSMSEPSLFHEDLRRKIRQRFRSIKDAFKYAMEDFSNADLHQNPKLTFPRFEKLLVEMDLDAAELKTLFDLIDANRDGALTIKEFLQGIRFFAPSCVLEDLRLQCLQRYENVWDAFTEQEIGTDRLHPLDYVAFKELLERQQFTEGVDVRCIFALLDVKHDGVVTISKLVAALQSGGPGNHLRQPSEERDQNAVQDVMGQLARHHRYIGELKGQVRQGLHTPDLGSSQLSRQASSDSRPGGELSFDASQSFTATGESSPGQMVGHRQLSAARKRIPHHTKKQEGFAVSYKASQKEQANQKDPKTPTAGGSVSDAGGEEEVHTFHAKHAPRIRAQPPEELAKYMAKLDPNRVQEHKKYAEDPISGSQESWVRLWTTMKNAPDAKERFEVEKELLQYYQKATKTVSHDVPLLERSHSRHAAVRSMRAHTKALASGNRVPKS